MAPVILRHRESGAIRSVRIEMADVGADEEYRAPLLFVEGRPVKPGRRDADWEIVEATEEERTLVRRGSYRFVGRPEQILVVLRDAAAATASPLIEYSRERSDWAPFEMCESVAVGRRAGLEREFPDGWSYEDLRALHADGFLQVEEVTTGRYEPGELNIRFRLARESGPVVGRMPLLPEGGQSGLAWCHECGSWIDTRAPDAWSVGMCASCAMDRSSEIAED